MLFCSMIGLSGAALLAGSALGGPRHDWHGMRGPMRQAVAALADADQDGTISDAERAAAREVIRARMQERKAKIIARFDADGDGELNESERQAIRAQAQDRRVARREHRAELKARIDVNRDGAVSPEERESARAVRRELRTALSAFMDADADGMISDAERAAAITHFKAGSIAPQ
jgi:hypothetical protein